jgi:glycosyltransferase involved in cell wall biosynthesis
MVDDLFGDVPEKHPNRLFQSREGHQRMMRALVQSDRLVVTTQTLKNHYDQYVRDVRVVPNTLRDQWFATRTPPKPRDRLRVGWVGAAQHQGDLDMIAAVIEATADKFDWVFMGMHTEKIKPFIKEYHDFVSISEYPYKIATLDLDIAIAPLEDNIFNRCKSNLRLLEYGSMCWPVICSDVYPYQTNDPPVIRCPSDTQAWINALEELSSNRELRLANGYALNRWVRDNYYYYYTLKHWIASVT